MNRAARFDRIVHIASLMGMVLWAACVWAVISLVGCSALSSGVEVCYLHPTYGAVCVKIGGKEYKLERADLSATQRLEVEQWLEGVRK